MTKHLVLCFTAAMCISCSGSMRRVALHELPPLVEPVSVAATRDDEDEKREDAYEEAAEFYMLKRVGPGKPLPIERYAAAREHAQRMPGYSIARKGVRAAATGTWQPLGPGNVGGRTRSLVVHPNDPSILYAGAVGGGVWKTTDGGASWLPLADLLPSIGISALAMDPQNTETLYAGTGEWYTNSQRGDSIRGLGIFKTDDGGANWIQLPGTAISGFYYVNKIVISPRNSQRVYAATWAGVYASADGGTSWRLALSRSSPNLGCQDLVIRSDQATDYLFASCLSRATGTQSAIFRNVDAAGAGSWQQVFTAPNLDRTSIALAPSNQSTIYAMAATNESGANLNSLLGVFRSLSNGDPDSWEIRTSGDSSDRLNRVLLTNPREAFADVCTNGTASNNHQGTYDNVIAVDPLNPDVVWAGGIDVFRSDDGGSNWGIAAFWQAAAPQMVHSDVHSLVFAAGSNQTLFAGTDGGVYRTENALAAVATGTRAACSPYPTEVQWTNLNNGYAATQFYHGAVYPGGGAYAGGAQDTGTNRGTDAYGPNGWRRLNGGDGGFFGIDPVDPNNVYNESQNLSFVRSTNGGLSFASATRGITEAAANFLFITPFLIDPNEPKRLYIGGKTLWRTTDGALNWSEASAAVATADGSISTIAIAPSDSNRMVFGTSTGAIYRNTNALAAGRTTVWLSALPRAGYVSRVSFDPNNPEIVYATYSQFKTTAAQSHVYKSTDGGATWNGIDGSGSAAIPDIPVFTLVVDPRNTSTLYLGTDIGVFVSVDGGASWSRDDNPFANAVTEILVLDRTAGQSNLFAFTHGRGVWRTALPGGGDPCQYDAPVDPVSLTAYGGTVPINVSAGDGCAWSAVPAGSFAVQSPAGGTGKGTVTVVTGMNNTTSARSGVIAIQDKSISIEQAPAVAVTGNDSAESAFDISSMPNVFIQNSSGASESASDPVHACTRSADAKTLWFKFIANDTGTLRLSFANRRQDNGADSGTVLTVYNSAGTEVVCSVTPQATTVITTRTPLLAVRQGDQLTVEVSATLFNAPAGAQILGGNLTLAAQIVKP